MEIYCDGGSNLWGSVYCVILGYKKDLIVLEKSIYPIECEYLAMIHALKEAKDGDIIYTDNRQVYLELNGLRKKKNNLFKEAFEILTEKPKIKILWIKRDKNLAGVYLDKRLKKINNSFKNVLRPRLPKIKKNWRKKCHIRCGYFY